MCLPSHREPFGLVYVEAGLAGKPVIACDGGGAPEVITHGETGLLIPSPFSPRVMQETTSAGAITFVVVDIIVGRRTTFAGLADAILTCSTTAVWPVDMGRRGRELALQLRLAEATLCSCTSSTTACWHIAVIAELPLPIPLSLMPSRVTLRLPFLPHLPASSTATSSSAVDRANAERIHLALALRCRSKCDVRTITTPSATFQCRSNAHPGETSS